MKFESKKWWPTRIFVTFTALLSLQRSVEWGKRCLMLIQCMCVWCHSPPVMLSQPLPFCPFSPGGQQTSVLDASTGRRQWVGEKRYELSQGWLRHSEAEARFSGTISSMGRRKWVKWPASSADHPYFSTNTSNRDHGLSLVMCLSSPAHTNTRTQRKTNNNTTLVITIIRETRKPSAVQSTSVLLFYLWKYRLYILNLGFENDYMIMIIWHARTHTERYDV